MAIDQLWVRRNDSGQVRTLDSPRNGYSRVVAATCATNRWQILFLRFFRPAWYPWLLIR